MLEGPRRLSEAGDIAGQVQQRDAQPAGLTCDQPVRGVLVARLSGDLDLNTVAALASGLESALGRAAPRRLVIDLSAVTLMSLKGVSLLMMMRRRARESGIHLVVAGSSHRCVAVPLGLSGVLPLFDTCVDVSHGLGSSGARATPMPGPRLPRRGATHR